MNPHNNISIAGQLKIQHQSSLEDPATAFAWDFPPPVGVAVVQQLGMLMVRLAEDRAEAPQEEQG